MTTLRHLAADLQAGRVTARALVDRALAAIEDPAGEGRRAFLQTDDAAARAVADGYDAIRRAGGALPPYAGIPIALKDLFDVAGQVTTAGSVVLADRPPATVDAPVVARVRAAGFIPVGRTNMTEFAYSGLGLNAHHDTPRSPWDRATGRIPGGSSSGTAVAVADGMAPVGLGTDTGGSCRIPAAFCGVVGFKPTASRIPLDGVTPLSFSLDSVGPFGRSVDCCAIVDDILSGGSGLVDPTPRPVDQVRLGVVRDLMLDDADPEVVDGFDDALARLTAAGISLVELPFPELDEIPHLYRRGGLAAAEAWAWHRPLLETRGDEYDQRVRTRIEPGADASAEYYIEVVKGRRRLVELTADRLQGLDGFVSPTVAILPPPIADFDDDDPAFYSQKNLLTLRNTSVGNFLDTCSISLPVTGLPEDRPVGLMLTGHPMGDDRLLSVARTVEVGLAT
ncbi:MAG: amidase [Actinomycetota bacterium]